MLDDPAVSIARVSDAFRDEARSIDQTEGISFDMGDWRFNLRSSNTETVVRLNVEARGNASLVARCVEHIRSLLIGANSGAN